MRKLNYKISSRATILLGREGVSKADSALIELIKNTYDADATICLLYFDVSSDTIYIFDNGVGMTQETVENHWMLIGTDNKRVEYQSKKGRIKSGEKGIGRFALDRLGSQCRMITKNKNENSSLIWETDWRDFEDTGKTLDQVEAIIYSKDESLFSLLPEDIRIDLSMNDFRETDFSQGTLLQISKLRDKWQEKDIIKIINSLGFLIPPTEQHDFLICVKPSMQKKFIKIENDISTDYDYKIHAVFDGESFEVILERNEFDLNIIPKEVFSREDFLKVPYRYSDFQDKRFFYKFSVEKLLNTKDTEIIESVRNIGPFKFDYIFMKLSLNDDTKETFFYRAIGKKRREWLSQYGGIKIYRDNFLVRPYGDPSSDSYDWLNLDSRKAKNPASISKQSGNWHVRNSQGQGTLFISRVHNDSILDKSNREGVIENKYFTLLKEVLVGIIGIFEKDRAGAAYRIKKYLDEVNEKEKTKERGKELAKIVNSEEKESNALINIKEEGEVAAKEALKTLAQTVQYFEDEVDDLLSEIKMLRSLATNGLMTTSIVHDLKGIESILHTRAKNFKIAIEKSDTFLIERNLKDLSNDDTFLRSWLSVVTGQINRDKRKRRKCDLVSTIKETFELLKPILDQKQISFSVQGEKGLFKKIFTTDFEAILYNLVINSIESFEQSSIKNRKISVVVILTEDSKVVIQYLDNGKGLSDIFSNPYDIFKFGETSKRDKDGKVTGTGLGMHIVSSTLREYNAEYKITEYKSGFGLDLEFPI